MTELLVRGSIAQKAYQANQPEGGQVDRHSPEEPREIRDGVRSGFSARDKEAHPDRFKIKVSIIHKIMLHGMILVFIAVGISTYLSVKTESKVLREGLIQKGKTVAAYIASSTESAFFTLNWVFVEKLLQESVQNSRSDIVTAKLIKPNGEVYFADKREYYGDLIDVSLLSKQQKIIKNHVFDQVQRKGMLLVHPISIGEETWYVLLGLSAEQINQVTRTLIYHNGLWGGCILLLAACGSFFLSKSISRPLIQLAEATRIVADGNWRHFTDISSKDEVGLLSHSFNRMVHGLEKTEMALKDSNERFLKVLDSISADVYVADIETYEILFMNKQMREAFGEDMVGEICWKSFRGGYGPCDHCTNSKLLDEKGNPGKVCVWECKNPITQRWYINYDRAIKWSDGRIVRLQVATDVTERKRAEDALQEAKAELERRVVDRTEALAKTNDELRHEISERTRTEKELIAAKGAAEKANRAKSEFLANMSHELRTPLNHIIGFTELVASKNLGEVNKDQEEYLQDALSSSRHLLELINDILDLSKVEAGKLEIKPADVDLTMLLENSINMVKETAMKRNIQLSVNIKGIPDTITGDELKLKQIIYNLLSNAVKFTPDRGTVRLVSNRVPGQEIKALEGLESAQRDYVMVSVIDTGIGLKEEDISSIFKPFEQVESSASRKFQGTGLGLSLTKSLVELHEGKIWAESGGEGEGATFSFCIPIELSAG